MEYDHRNRLVVVTDKDALGTEVQRVEFAYDTLDRRISKTVQDAAGEVVTHFVYDREDVILDFVDDDGAAGPNEPVLARRYLHGPGIDQVLAQEDATGNVLWHLTDHLGTVRDLADGTGAVKNHLTYDSFGNVVAQTDPTVATRYRFTGREFDPETGLYYYRARYYDASTGRFLGEDRVGRRRGVNRYVYVMNQPVSRLDPFGLIDCSGFSGRIKCLGKDNEGVEKLLQEEAKKKGIKLSDEAAKAFREEVNSGDLKKGFKAGKESEEIQVGIDIVDRVIDDPNTSNKLKDEMKKIKKKMEEIKQGCLRGGD